MTRRLLLLLALFCVSLFSWGGLDVDECDLPDVPDSIRAYTGDSLLTELDSADLYSSANSDTIAEWVWCRNEYGPGRSLRKYEDKKPMFDDLELNVDAVVWLVAGMAIFLVVVILVVTLGGYQRKRKAVSQQQILDTTVELVGGDLERTLGKGDYKEAVRILYVQTLTWLNNNGMIRWERSKTPIEYYYEMPEKSRKAPFLELTRIFLEARYDKIEVDRAMFDQAQKCANLIVKR